MPTAKKKAEANRNHVHQQHEVEDGCTANGIPNPASAAQSCENDNSVADEKYGGLFPFLSKIKKNYNRSKKQEERAEAPLLNRVALHAASITYTPLNAETTHTVSTPMPTDMLKFEEKLEKFA